MSLDSTLLMGGGPDVAWLGAAVVGAAPDGRPGRR